MKICFFGDAGNVHLRRIAAGLSDRGHTVRIVCHKPAEVAGVSVDRFAIPTPGLAHPFRFAGRWQRYLKGFLRDSDVVVLFFLHDWGFTPEVIERGCFVAFPQGSDVVLPPDAPSPSADLVNKRVDLLRHAASVATSGPSFARIVAEFAGLGADRVDRLPIGVDLKRFQPNPKRNLAGPDRIGFMKGFHAVYAPQYLVRAIPGVLERLPDTKIELVGEGPLLPQCRALADELGINKSIEWLPRQEHDQVPRLLSRWTLSVIPSICESFGVAALESSAMCVPVVASDVGGLPDTVRHRRTGLLVPPESPGALADAIIGLLENKPLLEEMGRRGRRWVSRAFEWNRVLDQWERVLARAVDRVCVAA